MGKFGIRANAGQLGTRGNATNKTIGGAMWRARLVSLPFKLQPPPMNSIDPLCCFLESPKMRKIVLLASAALAQLPVKN